MSQKIFRHSFFAGLLILLLCAAVFVGVIYGQIQQSVFAELEIEAGYLAAGIESGGRDYIENLDARRRITWVDSSGNVIFDNRADASAMANHLDRSEIAQAMESGSGSSRHFSSTTTESTLYYALKLSDGSVIRVSATQESISAMLPAFLRPLIWALVLVSLLCGMLASRLAKQITEPINRLDLDDPENTNPYRELKPLVRRVQEQNRTIRRQMDELGARAREFSAITENMSEGLIIVDNRAVIISSNSSGLEAVRLQPGELRSICRAKCLPEVCSGVDQALAGSRYENILELKGRMLQFIVDPVVSHGQVSGAVVLILDVTEREQREELRREFSANVSHELKTPLTSISGFAELMKEGLVPEEKMREFSADIYSESRRLLSLIEDILRLSRIDEGGSTPEVLELDLRDLACGVAQSLMPVAETAGVALSVSGESCPLVGNRRILTEMIYNLAENAIKYNRPGGQVCIDLRREGGEILLSVKDNGIGIPPEHHGRIFERFYRVDKSHSKLIGGTGLGLSIVRHGAKFHDASIRLESEPGQGTEISIAFPAKKEEI